VILGQKLILNHPFLVDEGEETRVLVTASMREKGKREKYKSKPVKINFIIKSFNF